jgi:hypothetical protein
MTKRKWLVLPFIALILLFVAGCGAEEEGTPKESSQDRADNLAANVETYDLKNTVELDNYNAKLALDDDPTTIIWCTAFPENASAPFITVPIAGKLTSSSTSALPPEVPVDRGNYSWQMIPNTSVDGLYHPNPPPYRFGFTPGGQYVDFTGLSTFCTTNPLQFQRESVEVDLDTGLNNATNAAQQALADGDKDRAQQIIEGAVAGG